MSDLDRLAQWYMQLWNSSDASERADLIRKIWVPEGRFVDPIADATGYDELEQMVTSTLAAFPGHTYRLASGIDQHHDQVRYAWQMVTDAGEVVINGLDVVRLAEDGRFLHLVGFFGDLPPAS